MVSRGTGDLGASDTGGGSRVVMILLLVKMAVEVDRTVSMDQEDI